MKCRGLLVCALFVARAIFGATELISNGGFEFPIQTNWQFSGDFAAGTRILPSAEAHSGNNVLFMGKTPGPVVQNAFQRISIPSNALNVTLSYFWSVSTSNTLGTAALETLIVNTNAAQTVLAYVETNFNNNLNYSQTVYDLTSLTGRTVDVYFQFQAASGSGSGTTFRIDDVSAVALDASDLPANDYFTNRVVLATNINLLATNILATKESGEPKHANVNGGHSLWWSWTAPSNGAVTINTDGSTFDTLLAVYTGSAVDALTEVDSDDDEENRGLLTSQVKFVATAGTQYQIAVDGKQGATGIVHLSLQFTPDTKAPSISISSPSENAQLSETSVLVQGKANDDLGVALVQYRLENAAGTNDYQNTDGIAIWSATVTNLVPGPNVIRIRAVDISSNETTVARTVVYVVTSPFTLNISGGGTVSPNLNGQLLNVGVSYTVTAKADKGQVFSGWTGDVTSSSPTLTFAMQSNMVLQANFIGNPFGPAAGIYQGLFYNTNVATHPSSGFITASVSSAGTFSAKLLIGGLPASLSGQFSGLGLYSNNIVRKGSTPVSAQLQIDLNGGGITGQLSDGVWTAQLNAPRAAFGKLNPAPQAGRYTLLLPGSTNSVSQPGGDSYGTVVVATTGSIGLSGVLSDGTKLKQKALLVGDGQWAFYAPVSSGAGSIFGWLTFSNQPASDISGHVVWFKPPGGAQYSHGFTNETDAIGSAYQFTSGVPVLNFADGQIAFTNGNLTSNFTNQIALGSDSKVVNISANSLKMKITTGTGLFKGTVSDPLTGRSIPFSGVVLQKPNFGGGFFLGTTQSGRVYFGP